MVIYQRAKTPFIFRFLKVFVNLGFWTLLAFGAVLFYFAGTEKPPMSYGMYFVVGILALFTYLMLHSVWVDSIDKIVLIEIVPTGLRIQQLKFDTVHEVTIEAGKLNVEVGTYNERRKRKWRSWYELKLSDKGEEHLFSLHEREAVICRILEEINEQNSVELRANENDFIKKHKHSVNSLVGRTMMLLVYGLRIVILIGVITAGYLAYQNYKNGGYMFELVSAIRTLSNEPLATDNLATYANLSEFPKKWFPLFESESGLIRHQFCSTEASIEIIERDGGYIWRELGFQDLWEVAIVNFVNESEGRYILTVQLEGGDTRQMTIVIVENDNIVYTIDDRLHTPNPNAFVISNSTDECL